jgi:hypothetical protein
MFQIVEYVADQRAPEVFGVLKLPRVNPHDSDMADVLQPVGDQVQGGRLPAAPRAVDAHGHWIETTRCDDPSDDFGHRIETQQILLRWVVVEQGQRHCRIVHWLPRSVLARDFSAYGDCVADWPRHTERMLTADS